jgi:hypothetical protein
MVAPERSQAPALFGTADTAERRRGRIVKANISMVVLNGRDSQRFLYLHR